MTTEDIRFSTPLYTVTEAAQHLGLKPSTLHAWTRGSGGRPAVIPTPAGPGRGASITFIGLAEGHALAAFRQAGVSMQRIRPALDKIKKEIGLAHALASRKLLTDGVEVLYEYAESTGDDAVGDLVVVRDGQRVFRDVVQDYLRCVTFGQDGYAELIRLPAYGPANVVANPRRAFGQPIFADAGTRVEDVIDRFYAGDSISKVAEEFGVTREQVEAALRVGRLASAA